MAKEVENRASLFWNCAISLNPETHTHRLLKSYYMNMCRKFVKNAVQIPREKFATTQMCSHCGCFWNESEFRMKLKSQHVSLKGKTKQLIEKLNRSKETGQKGALSGKQKKRAKWLQKRVTQRMEIMCDQCHHKSIVKLERPKRKQKKPTDVYVNEDKMEEEVVIIENDSKTKAKKKNKNKNKLAGLKLPLTVQPDKQKTKSQNVNKTPQKPPPPPSVAPTKQQTPKATQQDILPNKTKKKKKSATATTTPSSNANNKGVSKTQQQNSLLQLAALLKKNSSSDGKSSTQKRLESLLK